MSIQASSSMVNARSADEALRAYCEHFAARRPDELTALFSAHALVEIPLLKHHVRGAEVAPTLEQILAGLSSCEVQLRHVAGAGDTAMGEGHLSAQTENGALVLDFAIVVEVDDNGQIVRLSEYFDTDPITPLD
jgi:ketosteroid isomerase-like protein